MVTYKTTVKMHDTDAAGILFFGNQFKWIHDAYEILLERIGFGFATILRNTDFFIPIVHAESDYKSPLFVGDKIVITVKVGRIGRSSFTFIYEIHDARKKLVGSAKTIHVATDKNTRKTIPLPPKLKRALMGAV